MDYRIIILCFVLVVFIFPSSATTYTCCVNSTTSNGTTVQSFENAALWTLSVSGTSSKGADTIHYRDGAGSVYIDTGNVATAQARADMNLTFGTNQTVGVWAYSSNWSRVASVTFLYYKGTKYGDQGSMGKGFLNSTFSNTASNDSGWQYFTLNSNQFTFTNMSITDPVTYMRIKIAPAYGGIPANVSFDMNVINFAARPQFFFDFDDGRLNVSTMAYPVMAANNQKGNMFVTINEIDLTSAAINLSEMHKLQNAGWIIGSHIMNHVDMRTMNNTTIETQLSQSQSYLLTNGFIPGAYTIAYPVGGYDDNIINRTKNNGYIIGRTVNNGVWSANIPQTDPDTMHYRQTEFGSGVSVTEIKDEINNTIARNGTMHFLIHGITNDQASYALNYNLTDFTEISNYVASRSLDIDVVTYGDVMNAYTPPTPALLNSSNPQNAFFTLMMVVIILILTISMMNSFNTKSVATLAIEGVILAITIVVLFSE